MTNEFLVTCSKCGESFEEAEVNMIDYEDDLCIECEKEHKETL